MTSTSEQGRFWDWAVVAYGADGVAGVCLDLQDAHSQCVPLLLWAAWQEARGNALSNADVEDAVALTRCWADEVITPLRSARRRLKAAIGGDDPAGREALRDSVKAAELAAERELMKQLEAQVISGGGVDENLTAVAAAWSCTPPSASLSQALARLLQALTKGEVLGYSIS